MLKRLGIHARADLGLYLNKLKLHTSGIEVGTHRGEYAKQILDKWSAGTLYCVDPWEDSAAYAASVKYLWGNPTREQDFADARKLLAPHGNRAQFMRMKSVDAVSAFPDESLDFVYIDGDHVEPSVSLDMKIWWPKVRPGGLMLGHDFVMDTTAEDDWSRFIQPAIFLFAEEHKRTVHMIDEPDDLPWSYCIHK